MSKEKTAKLMSLAEWTAEYNRVKFHWVVVVVLFWATTGITAGLFIVQGHVYLNELIFIAGIFMVLGVYLKTKVMVLERKKPGA
ncbi:MAG: hypothetical protein CSA50_03490 [Gammaproteobacteria bacterium]|nr:MAG: hypothetical protein CSA50_03490 [Gammaproteobacteria bacterium]